MLTEKAIQEIEKAIGITGLQEILMSSEPVEITLKKTKHFDEASYNQLIQNLQNSLSPELYSEAKQAGEEIAVKEIKRANQYEFEGKSVKALNEYLTKQIELKSKTDISEIEKQYKDDLDKLRKTVETERSEKEKIAQQRKADKINWIVDNHFNSLQIDAPANLKEPEQINQFRKNEIEKNKIYFKSQYQFDVDESGNLLVKDLNNTLLKDELQNPVKIDNVVKDFAAKNFIQFGQQGTKGRGGKDEFPGTNNLSGIKDIEQLKEYAAKLGVKPNTQEFDALYIEFKKTNKI